MIFSIDAVTFYQNSCDRTKIKHTLLRRHCSVQVTFEFKELSADLEVLDPAVRVKCTCTDIFRSKRTAGNGVSLPDVRCVATVSLQKLMLQSKRRRDFSLLVRSLRTAGEIRSRPHKNLADERRLSPEITPRAGE
ncbi:hypothetical protein EVAR_635_1 [Eumeta japonica]|uniref:Uncharacterized protein n=1 Tax=Eumeta variegata TaxID=151549 RepID=A0A4C1SB93_EUMVA|nr:hypothetical protein EVAR_635_1 [Eumeta japonica]